MPRATVGNLLWLMAYVAVIAAIVWKVSSLRQRMLSELDTPEARAQWQEWREKSVAPGPVERRQPKSTEPPLLVLLRDYYGTCLTAGVVFSSLLFLVLMIFIRGMFRPRQVQ